MFFSVIFIVPVILFVDVSLVCEIKIMVINSIAEILVATA